jgi:AGZA family xanthine/uracil permease-like MFS transporter
MLVLYDILIGGPIMFYQWQAKMSSFRGDHTGNWAPLLSAISVFLVGILYMYRSTLKAPIIVCIIVCSLLGLPGIFGIDDVKKWDPVTADTFLPKWENVAGQLDFSKMSEGKFWDFSLSLLFYQIFDAFGTLTGVAARAKLLRYKDSMAQIQRGMYGLYYACTHPLVFLYCANTCMLTE